MKMENMVAANQQLHLETPTYFARTRIAIGTLEKIVTNFL
jgi:hypothetical protein